MIRVNRGPEPDNFTTRALKWLDDMEVALANDPKLTPSKYWSRIRPQIMDDAAILKERFHGKCSFCEQPMDHVSSPHIEHYRPKGLAEFRHLTFDWANWHLSCGRCNENKWKHFPMCAEFPCLIDPTSENPSDHITFENEKIAYQSERGKKTINLVKLDRNPVERERIAWLTDIRILLLCCLIDEIKLIARDFLIWSLQPEAPFTGMVRTYLITQAPGLANPESPHPHIHIDNAHDQIERLVDLHKDEIALLL